jgi:hypothetical protein
MMTAGPKYGLILQKNSVSLFGLSAIGFRNLWTLIIGNTDADFSEYYIPISKTCLLEVIAYLVSVNIFNLYDEGLHFIYGKAEKLNGHKNVKHNVCRNVFNVT